MSSLAKSKSDFNSMSLFSGYSGKREKSEDEREMEKKLFYGRKAGVSKLARHGFYEDNSMEAKDRNDRRSKVQLERKMSSMNRLNTNFLKEVEKVKALQRQLAARQQTMAVTANEKYTVTYIQSIWRGYLGRLELRKLKAARLLRSCLRFRYRWRLRCRCRDIIMSVYRKYKILKCLKEIAFPSQMARVIQKAYRRRFLRARGVIRFRANQVWEHVKVFGFCRAKIVLCPLEKKKRIIYNAFLRFHQKIRARRIFNAANVHKLFLGLYFCQTPLAQREVKNAATYYKIGKRERSLPASKALLLTRRSALARNIHSALLDTKVSAALEKHSQAQNKSSTNDTLGYLKKKVVALGLSNMEKRVDSPLLRNRKAPNSRGVGRRDIPPNGKPKSPATKPPSAGKRSSKFSGEGKNLLDSVNSYRNSMQNYKIPKRLINLCSYSQLDPNSIFASQLSSKSNKVVPYELQGFFRLKTVAEVVFFLQDLSAATRKCPELLNDPFEDFDTGSKSKTSSDFPLLANILESPPQKKDILSSIRQNLNPLDSEGKDSLSTGMESLGKRNARRGGKQHAKNSSNAPAKSPTASSKNRDIDGMLETSETDGNKGSKTRFTLLEVPQEGSRRDNTKPVTPPDRKEGITQVQETFDENAPISEDFAPLHCLLPGNNPRHVSESPTTSRSVTSFPILKPTGLSNVEPDIAARQNAKRIEVVHESVEENVDTENSTMFPLHSATPQLSQSTTTVPEVILPYSPSNISQASTMRSDDDYEDDFESMSHSRSNNVSASGLRPSKPTTPIPSSAFYRRQSSAFVESSHQ